MKTTLFYFYFMAILMLSHLFFSYFILANLYFIPTCSLPDEKVGLLFYLFCIYFKPIFKEDRTKWGILFVFSHKIVQNRLFYPYFSLGGKGDDLLLCRIDI